MKIREYRVRKNHLNYWVSEFRYRYTPFWFSFETPYSGHSYRKFHYYKEDAVKGCRWHSGLDSIENLGCL